MARPQGGKINGRVGFPKLFFDTLVMARLERHDDNYPIA